jgi:hypothetical protein
VHPTELCPLLSANCPLATAFANVRRGANNARIFFLSTRSMSPASTHVQKIGQPPMLMLVGRPSSRLSSLGRAPKVPTDFRLFDLEKIRKKGEPESQITLSDPVVGVIACLQQLLPVSPSPAPELWQRPGTYSDRHLARCAGIPGVCLLQPLSNV